MLISLQPDMLNALAVAVMMGCLVPVANLMSPRKHPWYMVLLMVVLVLLYASFQASWHAEGEQVVSWSTAALHMVWASALLICRRRAWLFVRVELGDLELEHPSRRADDVREVIGAA